MFNQIKWIWIDQGQIELRTIRTDNANAVGDLTDATRFTMPANIDIWNPSNGDVITIMSDCGTPHITLDQPNNGDSYSSGSRPIAGIPPIPGMPDN